MARFEPVIHSAAWFLQHHPVFGIDEVLLHGFGQRLQGIFYCLVIAYREGREERFSQMHQRILQRAATKVRPVFIEAGFIQAVIPGETFGDHTQCCIEGGLDQLLANLSPVVGAGKEDEGVGVEVLAPIQRFALGIDAVEPAAMLGIVEVPLQRAE
ncbi:hypothetical protein D3C84_710090 [compost metagenome]